MTESGLNLIDPHAAYGRACAVEFGRISDRYILETVFTGLTNSTCDIANANKRPLEPENGLCSPAE